MLARKMGASPEAKKSPRKDSPKKEAKARKFSLTGKKGSLPEGQPPAGAPAAESPVPADEEAPVVRPAPIGEVVMVELSLKRKNGALGIAIRDDTLVTEIDPGSGGEESGLLVGDYIMELGDQVVNNYAEMLPFLKSMGDTSIRALIRRNKPEDPEVAAAKEAADTKEAAEAEEARKQSYEGVRKAAAAAREARGINGVSAAPPKEAEEAEEAEEEVVDDADPRRLAIEAALDGSAGRAAIEQKESQEPSGLSGLLKQLSSNSKAAFTSAAGPGGLTCCQARPAKALTSLPPKEEESPPQDA